MDCLHSLVRCIFLFHTILIEPYHLPPIRTYYLPIIHELRCVCGLNLVEIKGEFYNFRERICVIHQTCWIYKADHCHEFADILCIIDPALLVMHRCHINRSDIARQSSDIGELYKLSIEVLCVVSLSSP